MNLFFCSLYKGCTNEIKRINLSSLYNVYIIRQIYYQIHSPTNYQQKPNRAKGCKRNGNFLLNKLSAKYERKKLGLYRDDGLTIFKNDSGPSLEKLKKIFL